MKYKVSELEGALLDAAVALAEGIDYKFVGRTLPDGSVGLLVDAGHDEEFYSPSTDWAYGGPIIEREKIVPQPDDVYEWIPPQIGETYLISPANPNGGRRGQYLHTRWEGGFSRSEPNAFGFGGPMMTMCYSVYGSTMLECAMREHVGRKFGPEVEIPTVATPGSPRPPDAATGSGSGRTGLPPP